MSSREEILGRVKQNQPAESALPPIINYDQHYESLLNKFTEMLRFIGGEVHLVTDTDQVLSIIKGSFKHANRIIASSPIFATVAEVNHVIDDAHTLHDVDLFITTSNLGVAENGSMWVRDEQLVQRALPFIAQQIAVLIKKEDLVATMHDAYDVIGNTDYNYAAFIAGPSKTADIEQSLVLGAHGPKTMTCFLLV